MRQPRTWFVSRWPWWVLVAVVLVVVVLPVWPGRLNYDTDDMLGESLDNRFTDFHSPVLMMLYTPVVRLIGITPAPLLIGQVVVIVLALGAILRAAGLSRRGAIITTSLLVVSPLFVTAEISVTRDTWFVAFMLALVAVAVHPHLSLRARWWLLGGVGFLTIASRQNAPAVILVCLGWRLWTDLPSLLGGRPAAVRRATRLVLSATCAVLVTIALGAVVVAVRVVGGAKPAGPEAVLFYVDLDELSTRVDQQLIPPSATNGPVTLDYLRETSLYSLDKTFYVDARAPLKQPPEARGPLRTAWVNSILEWPGQYLHVRWKMLTRQMGWSGPTVQTYLPETGTSYTVPSPTLPGPSGVVSDYLSWFNRDGDFWKSGPIHRPWAWFVGGWVVAAVRRRRIHVLLAAMATAHVAALFVLAPTVLYRLAQPQVLLNLISVAIAVAHWLPSFGRWMARRQAVGLGCCGVG